MKKVVTIDLRKIHDTGIGTYLANLTPMIVRHFADVTFNLIGSQEVLSQQPWTKQENITCIHSVSSPLSIHEQFELPRIIPKETSIYWAPHFNIPLLYRGKLLVTIHDIIQLSMPSLAGGLHQSVYVLLMLLAIKRNASRIISGSHFTASELARIVHVAPSKMTTIYYGVHGSWFTIPRDAASPHPKPYLLFVGNVKPNKNLSTLVQAFELIQANIPHNLVIVGRKDGIRTLDQSLLTRIGSNSQRIHFTGHVSQVHLQQYVTHAEALVFPSLYEGFGLPPLEAMACGCPVIVSRIPPLQEVCGEAALYCDPHSPQDIAAQIQRLVDDRSLRTRLTASAKERATTFTWERCAAETAHTLEQLL